MWIRNALAALGVLAAVGVAGAQAATIEFNVISAAWTNTVGGINVVSTAGDPATLSWGTYGTSSYVFDAATTPFSTTENTVFELGKFTHNNQPIGIGSSITSTRLDIMADVTIDNGGGPVPSSTGPYLFSFLHNETPNWCAPWPSCSNDLVTISNLETSDVIDIGGQMFTLTVLGFLVDGIVTTDFSTKEKRSNMANVVASWSVAPGGPDPQFDVPLPAAAWLLLSGIGVLTGVSAARRRAS